MSSPFDRPKPPDTGSSQGGLHLELSFNALRRQLAEQEAAALAHEQTIAQQEGSSSLANFDGHIDAHRHALQAQQTGIARTRTALAYGEAHYGDKEDLSADQARNFQSLIKTGKTLYEREKALTQKKHNMSINERRNVLTQAKHGMTPSQRAYGPTKVMRDYFLEVKGLELPAANTQRKHIEAAKGSGQLSNHARQRKEAKWKAKSKRWQEEGDGYVTTDVED